ncbi:PAS domain S-box-containing protein [Dongia mobilis]|uniref:PAS domain S-box-containing protein n=1 Tax=Dongia mobilis TaxID=578943 RepID=A0A4R6WY20_9PROT|nr:PAS domain-containing protein [Dongia mobilis]TDQ84333.1 PAS domain S-box-containing protein [Dongia mobilis]
MRKEQQLTGVERHFAADDVIVTKTDLKGRITYVNRTFLDIAGLTLDQALGAPHSIIRHPAMPRCVFKLLWDTIEGGREIFAFVVNRAVNGDHYWVLAHVTPSFGPDGKIIGYHSNRRVADPRLVRDVVTPLYAELCAVENAQADRKQGMLAAHAALVAKLQAAGVSYDRFFFSLLDK